LSGRRISAIACVHLSSLFRRKKMRRKKGEEKASGTLSSLPSTERRIRENGEGER
jgi:hypothetical protein